MKKDERRGEYNAEIERRGKKRIEKEERRGEENAYKGMEEEEDH